MANLPTVPQSDIESAIDKMNRPNLALSQNILTQLQLNTDYLMNISQTLKDALKLDEMRIALEKQREGLLIEERREAERRNKNVEPKKENTKFSLKDLLGVEPSFLMLAGLAAGLTALAIAIKTQFEELATAIQGWVALKLVKKFKDLIASMRGNVVRSIDQAIDSLKGLKNLSFFRRLASLGEGLKALKFPRTLDVLGDLKGIVVGVLSTMTGFIRTQLYQIYGLSDDGKKVVVRGADGRFQKPIVRGMVESVQDMFKNMRTNLTTFIDDILKGFNTRLTAPIAGIYDTIVSSFSRIGSSISGLFTSVDVAGDVQREAGVISKFFSGVASFFRTGGAVLGEIVKPIQLVLGFLGGVVFDTIGTFFRTTGSVIGGLFDFLGPVIQPLKSVFGIIGKFSIILTPFFALYDFITGFWKGYTEGEGSFVKGLEGGLLEVFRGFFTKPLDLLREYIVAPFVGLFSKDAEKAVKNFNITELFNNAYETVKKFIQGLFTGETFNKIGKFFGSLPNPLDFVGEKLFTIFSGIAKEIETWIFPLNKMSGAFGWMADSVAKLFDLDKTTGLSGSSSMNMEGAQTVGAGGASASQVNAGTREVASGQSAVPIVVSAPTTQNNTNVSTQNNSNNLAVGSSPRNTTPSGVGSDPFGDFS